MRVCPECNKENPHQATHCMNCGALLVGEEQLSEVDKLRKELREAKKTIEQLNRSLEDLQQQLKNASNNVDSTYSPDKIKEYEETIVDLQNNIDIKNSEISILTSKLSAPKNEKKSGKWKYLFFVALLALIVMVVVAFAISGSAEKELSIREREVNDLKDENSELKTKINNLEKNDSDLSIMLDSVKDNMDSIKNELSEMYESFPLIIKEVEVASVDNKDDTVGDYGSNINGNETRYLKPRIVYKINETKNVPLELKLRYYGDEDEYELREQKKNYFIKQDEDTLFLDAFVIDGYYFDPGSGQIEIWFNDICLKSKRFRIY